MNKPITTNPRLIAAKGTYRTAQYAMSEPSSACFFAEASSLKISQNLLEAKWELERHIACSNLEGDFGEEYRARLIENIEELESKLPVKLEQASAAIVAFEVAKRESRVASAALRVVESEEGVEADSYEID